MKLKKNVPLIDQHDKYGFWGGKFGGSYIPETLKKPIEDLTITPAYQFFRTERVYFDTFDPVKKFIEKNKNLKYSKK